MRALDPAGAQLGDPRAVSPIADARFAVAGSGDRAGVVYVEDGVVQLAELASDGAVVRTSSISDPSVVATEPRLVALRSGGWAGTYLANDTLYAFETGAGITPVGPACTPCVSDPSYLLPAVATDGEHLAVLWPRDDAGERELVWAIVGPGAPTPVVIARGANVRWPALGFDGRRWVAVHDEGAGLVRVQRLPPGEGSAGIDTRTVPGSQRLPSLVRVP
jgi:hypothetical protein